MLHYQHKIAIIQGEKAKKCIFFKKNRQIICKFTKKQYLCNRKQITSAAGCSSVRLEYASGGRVVAGSNPVIPTKTKP